MNLKVKLRRPAWAATGFKVAINGRRQALSGGPGSWVSLEGPWQSGDAITVTMPFALRVEGFADNPDRFAFLNGPLVLCAQVEPGKPFPVVVAERGEIIKALGPAGQAQHLPGSGRELPHRRHAGGAPALKPFYAMHGERHYAVYFDRLTRPAAGQGGGICRRPRAAAPTLRAHGGLCRARSPAERARPQDARQNTDAGDFSGRQWRHATEGGWFSWQMKVLPDQAQELCVTYWGGDAGNRVFDLLVDNRKIATQRLENNQPGKFFDQSYPIPAELLKGKTKVSVGFQAHPGAWAGGVFGARMMKAGD